MNQPAITINVANQVCDRCENPAVRYAYATAKKDDPIFFCDKCDEHDPIHLRELFDIIDEMRNGSHHYDVPDHIREYAKTLTGPRTRGSTTVKSLLDFSPEYPIHRFHSPCVTGPASCYRVHCPGIGGVVCALPYDEAKKLGSVTVEDGAHGPELVVYVETNRAKLNTDDIYIIVDLEKVGTQTMKVVSTWHPGKPLGILSDGVNSQTGVKVIEST